MIDGVDLYVVIRLTLSIAHALGWLWVLRLAVPLARRAEYADQRLFVVAVVGVLAMVSILLTLTALYDWNRPPSPDSFLAFSGIAIRAVLTIAAGVIIWKWPFDGGR